MNNQLIEILEKLKSDVSVVVYLYEELYNANFFVLTRPETELKLELLEFLTYPAEDQIIELPIFTKKEFILEFPEINYSVTEVVGAQMWPSLISVINNEKLQVAVDPGQSHGIRLTKQMIAGMISMYNDR
jgi:hypothetical protein